MSPQPLPSLKPPQVPISAQSGWHRSCFQGAQVKDLETGAGTAGALSTSPQTSQEWDELTALSSTQPEDQTGLPGNGSHHEAPPLVMGILSAGQQGPWNPWLARTPSSVLARCTDITSVLLRSLPRPPAQTGSHCPWTYTFTAVYGRRGITRPAV